MIQRMKLVPLFLHEQVDLHALAPLVAKSNSPLAGTGKDFEFDEPGQLHDDRPS